MMVLFLELSVLKTVPLFDSQLPHVSRAIFIVKRNFVLRSARVSVLYWDTSAHQIWPVARRTNIQFLFLTLPLPFVCWVRVWNFNIILLPWWSNCHIQKLEYHLQRISNGILKEQSCRFQYTDSPWLTTTHSAIIGSVDGAEWVVLKTGLESFCHRSLNYNSGAW